MVNYKKALFLALTFLIALHTIAQNNVPDVSKENGFMRTEGKIYVVMVVAITILFGLLLYLFRLDRKLSKLEKGENV